MVAPAVSPATRELYDALAPLTSEDASMDWHLLHLCQALMLGIDPLHTLVYDNIDDESRLGWADILDVATVPNDWLQWYAQMAGVILNPGMTIAQQRSAITTRPGQRRGLPAVIIAAVQSVLRGTRRAVIIERDTSAYHATVTTYVVQTPSVDAVLAAIIATKPAGLIIDHVLLTSATYDQVRASKVDQTFDGRKAAYPTYNDVYDYVP